MAEAVFLHILKERGLSDKWKVDSAGLGGWHSGNLPDSRARAVLKKHNIEYSNRARQVKIFIYNLLDSNHVNHVLL